MSSCLYDYSEPPLTWMSFVKQSSETDICIFQPILEYLSTNLQISLESLFQAYCFHISTHQPKTLATLV